MLNKNKLKQKSISKTYTFLFFKKNLIKLY